MSGKRTRLNVRRTFDEGFKKARVKEYEKGEFSIRELSTLFDISIVSIYRWIHKYSVYNKKKTIIVEMKDSANQKLKEYEQRIADLERALGQKQLNVDFLEKMIDLAEKEFEIDIKKNSNTPLSNGSEKTRRK